MFGHHDHHHHHHQHHSSMLQWMPSGGGQVPPTAVQGGYDFDCTIFVGRAYHNGDLVPGKVVPSHGCCYIPYGGDEQRCHSYEVLTNPNNVFLTWEQASEGYIPPGAVQAGHTSSGEPLFVGRHTYEGTLTVGKVHPSHRCLYISFGGREQPFHHGYEVLVAKSGY